MSLRTQDRGGNGASQRRRNYMRASKYALIIGMLVMAPFTVKADTITETFTVPQISGNLPNGASKSGTSFSLFNPALGTLNSITFDIEASFTLSNGGATDVHSPEFAVEFWDGSTFVTTLQSPTDGVTGNVSGTLSFTKTYVSGGVGLLPGGFDAFIGTGSMETNIDVRDEIPTVQPDSISMTFTNPETVTYNYTPSTVGAVPAVPEPGSFALFGTVLAVIGCSRLRPRSRRPDLR